MYTIEEFTPRNLEITLIGKLKGERDLRCYTFVTKCSAPMGYEPK